MLSKQAAPRIVVLKEDRLYGDLISRQIKELWRNATILVFQHGFDALESIQAEPPDLFIAGVKIDDMDGLEHLEPFIDSTLPILVLTSRKESRTFEMLRGIRYDDHLADDAGLPPAPRRNPAGDVALSLQRDCATCPTGRPCGGPSPLGTALAPG